MTDARLVASNPENSSIVPVACNAAGQILVADVVIEQISNDVNIDGDLSVTGDASFKGIVSSGNWDVGVDQNSFYITPGFVLIHTEDSQSNSPAIAVYSGSGDAITNRTVSIKGDGSATFADGKAGFTADGWLWCTTERGDTVRLKATSNGLGSWEEYTPTSLKAQVEDKLEGWSEKDKPSES